MKSKRWYERIPNPYILLFLIIVMAGIMTYIVPAGEFDRAEVGGRMGVVAGTYHRVDQAPVGLFDLFTALPIGMVKAASIIFITLISGALFGLLNATGALENAVGLAVRRIGVDKGPRLVWLMTFVFGFLGATVGFENNIALVPIAILVALALGGDLMVGAGMAVAGIGVGFATSPINPYTVGVGHVIANLPIFSGALLRTGFCLASLALVADHTCRYLARIKKDRSASLVAGIDTEGLSLRRPLEEYSLDGRDRLVLASFLLGMGIILFGVFQWKWYITEISAVFIIMAVVAGYLAGMTSDAIIAKMVRGAGDIAGGALIIGVARGIQVILDDGRIGDTIVQALASPLSGLPVTLSAILMTVVHSVINFFIPSGSGQAMATLPIMIPLSDLIGMTRQTAILAFQVGDGVMNLLVPTLGGLLAMIALARVPFDRWFRFAFPLVLKILVVSWAFLALAVAVNWGPA
ncbi:YfcC family protein [Aminithiophilus ramosus]|uniref:YfcC family protein n=2 Tax=Synergistales TaxID=649776 RepID=A0A9Q7AFJ6_9BACT|nr:TIGR00366 family protein [Aminithiophilus ramosus]QTX33284.1 YfcC family protein [Aminithiophilus ramosus]QVL36968.1 YfcC family protein [Synergistota bacterium]